MALVTGVMEVMVALAMVVMDTMVVMVMVSAIMEVTTEVITEVITEVTMEVTMEDITGDIVMVKGMDTNIMATDTMGTTMESMVIPSMVTVMGEAGTMVIRQPTDTGPVRKGTEVTIIVATDIPAMGTMPDMVIRNTTMGTMERSMLTTERNTQVGTVRVMGMSMERSMGLSTPRSMVMIRDTTTGPLMVVMVLPMDITVQVSQAMVITDIMGTRNMVTMATHTMVTNPPMITMATKVDTTVTMATRRDTMVMDMVPTSMDMAIMPMVGKGMVINTATDIMVGITEVITEVIMEVIIAVIMVVIMVVMVMVTDTMEVMEVMVMEVMEVMVDLVMEVMEVTEVMVMVAMVVMEVMVTEVMVTATEVMVDMVTEVTEVMVVMEVMANGKMIQVVLLLAASFQAYDKSTPLDFLVLSLTHITHPYESSSSRKGSCAQSTITCQMFIT